MENKILTYFTMGVIGLGIGLGIGYTSATHSSTPTSVCIKDLNEDKRPDIIVTTRHGDKSIHLQQEDGSFKRLGEVQEQLRKTIEGKVKDIK